MRTVKGRTLDIDSVSRRLNDRILLCMNTIAKLCARSRRNPELFPEALPAFNTGRNPGRGSVIARRHHALIPHNDRAHLTPQAA